MTLDLSNVPHVAERKRIAELQAQRDQLEWDKDEKCADVRRRKHAATEPLWVPFREAVKATEAPFLAEEETISAEIDKQIEAIDAELEALPSLYYNEEYTEFYTCEVTGLLVLEDDEVVRDELSGEVILRAVIPFPAA